MVDQELDAYEQNAEFVEEEMGFHYGKISLFLR